MQKDILLHLSPLAEVGGCEVNCLRVIEALGSHRHCVVVFGETGPMSAKWEGAGAQVVHLGAWRNGARKFRSALAAWTESHTQPAGIFYWSTSRLPAVIEALRAWDAPCCVHLGNPVSGGFVSSVRRWMQERFHHVPRNLTLVACSKHVAASHRRAFYFRRMATEVIYNPVSSVFARPHQYRELPAGSRPRIGMVARLDRIKDHSAIIRAVAAIKDTRPDLVVEFAGDGELRQELEAEANRFGVADRVRFLGFAKIPPLLAEWDIYVHSTTASEGMGTSIAEAMTAGLPCVASDLQVMREVCGNDSALYFPAGNAASLGRILLQLIENRAHREALGRAGQAWARSKFASEEVAQAYLQVVSPIPA